MSFENPEYVLLRRQFKNDHVSTIVENKFKIDIIVSNGGKKNFYLKINPYFYVFLLFSIPIEKKKN